MLEIESPLQKELEAVRYIYEQFRDSGEMIDLGFDLCHNQPKQLLKKIQNGDNIALDPACFEFLELYVNKGQFDLICKNLKEMKARRAERDRLQSELKNVFNPDIDYSTSQDERTLKQGLSRALETMKGNPKGLETGVWSDLESVIGGLKAGELMGIVGESESGKTTLALNYFDKIMQANPKVKGLNISLEMDESAFTKKIIKMRSDMTQRHLVYSVNNENLDLGSFSYGAWDNCVFSYSANTLAKIKKLIETTKPNIVMVDHLQFVINDQRLSLGEWVNFFCNGLKQVAKQNGCGIILLSQIDKEGAKTHFIKGEEKKLKPKLVNAWGGIAFKASLDCGLVISRNGTESICYWDKVREVWDGKNRYNDFSIGIDGDKGIIQSMVVKSETH